MCQIQTLAAYNLDQSIATWLVLMTLWGWMHIDRSSATVTVIVPPLEGAVRAPSASLIAGLNQTLDPQNKGAAGSRGGQLERRFLRWKRAVRPIHRRAGFGNAIDRGARCWVGLHETIEICATQ
jgi:hypothetical protein